MGWGYFFSHFLPMFVITAIVGGFVAVYFALKIVQVISEAAVKAVIASQQADDGPNLRSV